MRNPAGEDFGYERLWAAVQESGATHGAPAQGICDAVLGILRNYQGSAPQADDVTLVVLRATG
jgi:serine phosphatase RsbU (regulator of sigma subunit)